MKEKGIMPEQLQTRIDTLRKELEVGQQRLQELEHEQGRVRDTMLRISGAIQVLEEMQKETPLASEASDQSKSAHNQVAAGEDT